MNDDFTRAISDTGSGTYMEGMEAPEGSMTAYTYLTSAEMIFGNSGYRRTFNSDWTYTDQNGKSGTWMILDWNRFQYTKGDGKTFKWTWNADEKRYYNDSGNGDYM
jgi:hypothetical protein